MNNEYKLEKLRRWCAAAQKILRAAQVLLVALPVVAGAVIAWASVYDPENLRIEFSFLGKYMTPSAPPVAVLVTIVVIACLAKIALTMVMLENVRRITSDIAAGGSPFVEVEVKRMKRVAILIAVSSVIHTFTSTLVDLTVALVVWMLAMVFEYGCVLQQESDETL